MRDARMATEPGRGQGICETLERACGERLGSGAIGRRLIGLSRAAAALHTDAMVHGGAPGRTDCADGVGVEERMMLLEPGA